MRVPMLDVHFVSPSPGALSGFSPIPGLATGGVFMKQTYSLNLKVVRELFDEVVELVEAGHYVLALINSCYSGAFLKRPFGERHFFPKHGGAHAITAGGRELTWHDPKIGTRKSRRDINPQRWLRAVRMRGLNPFASFPRSWQT